MIRPVSTAPSQLFGDNPTRDFPASHWIIKAFGNYQPDGHTGEDYPCPTGTPVRAVTAGTVLHVGWFGGTYADNPWWIAPAFAGYCYVVDHGSFIGIYGHCLDGGAKVRVGQTVSEGQALGPSGNTGASTGDHLHFEVLPDGYVLNSYMYGRINPAPLFGGITNQGTITPLEEDVALTKEEVDWIAGRVAEVIQPMHDVTREFIPGAVLNRQVSYKDPITGQGTGQTTSLATMAGFADFQHTNTRESLLAAVRGIVDAVKAAPGPDAAKAAEDAYAAFAEKLAGIKLTVTAGGE